MALWLHRTEKTLITSTSPRGMERNFGGVFVDADGKGVSNADWIMQPDLSAVEGHPIKHWLIAGDAVTLAGAAARAAIDIAIANTRLQQQKQAAKDFDQDRRLLGFMETMAAEITILRNLHSLGNRTLSQYKAQVRLRIDGQS